MFDNLKNMGAIMKAAAEAKTKMAELQKELERRSVTGEAGGGAVRVTMNGKMQAQRVQFDPVMIAALSGDDGSNQEMIEDLTAAAITDAVERVQKLVQEEMQKITGGLDLPGMQGLLGQ